MRYALVVAVLAVGCGGADREEFVSAANDSCVRLENALKGAGSHDATTQAYERELDRLRALEPPGEDEERFERMLQLKEEALRAWREFAAAFAQDQHAGTEALDRSRKSLVQAAQVAGELGLGECDSALS
jgi:hypothetical protein